MIAQQSPVTPLKLKNAERDGLIIAGYAGGKTHGELGAQFGMNPASIGGILRKNGIGKPLKSNVRPVKTIELTALQISRKAERARRTERRMRVQQAADDAKALVAQHLLKITLGVPASSRKEIWGCSGAEYWELVAKYGPESGNDVMTKYLHQRSTAKVGKHGWYFTFKTWLGMTERYGCWDDHALASGAFKIVRIRTGSTPYSPQTCRIEYVMASQCDSRFERHIVKDNSTHFDKLGLTEEEYCQHIAEYGDHNDVESPISKYMADEFSQVNPTCSFTLTFKQWCYVWGCLFIPVNAIA